MDLRHLRYFLCVAEEMHFGRAAERLGISQPPLSQQIKALEEELGIRLFDRTSRRVRLTREGELFAPEARRTLQQADHAIAVARQAQRGEVGRLALGFTASAPFVPAISRSLYRFRQGYPAVQLSIQELGRTEQLAALEQGEIDIAMVRGTERPVLPDGFVTTCLSEENMVLALWEDHPLAHRAQAPAIADLRDETLVLYTITAGAGFNEYLVRLCEEEGFPLRIEYEVSGLATLLGLVAAGFGVSILAQSLERLHVDNVVYRSFSPPIFTRLWLVYKPGLSPSGQAFIGMLENADKEG